MKKKILSSVVVITLLFSATGFVKAQTPCVAGIDKVAELVAGDFHILTLKRDGTGYGWAGKPTL